MSGIIEQFMKMMVHSTGFGQITGGMIIMWLVCVVLVAILKPHNKFKGSFGCLCF